MAKVDTGRQFDDATISMLASLIGRRLVSCTAYMPHGSIYKRARLDFDGVLLDVSNVHEEIPIGPDFEDEQLAVLSVALAGGELWCPPGKELSCLEYGFEVDDVLVVVDTILLNKGSVELNKIKLVQALAFEHDGKLLALDRDIWSDEYLNIREGDRISEVTRDHRGDWVVEPPCEYRFGRHIIRASSPDA